MMELNFADPPVEPAITAARLSKHASYESKMHAALFRNYARI
jgi:hypothetical protein